MIATHVYISKDDNETSLLGKIDAERLGIVKINLRGSREEVNRIKVCRKSELKKKKGEKPEKEKEDVEKMDKMVAEFGDIFKGIGKYRAEPVKIQIPDNISPIIQPPRRIPLHYVQPLKDCGSLTSWLQIRSGTAPKRRAGGSRSEPTWTYAPSTPSSTRPTSPSPPRRS